MPDPPEARHRISGRRGQPIILTPRGRQVLRTTIVGFALAIPAGAWAVLSDSAQFVGFDGLAWAAFALVIATTVPFNYEPGTPDRRMSMLLLAPICALWAASVLIGNVSPTTETISFARKYVAQGRGGGPELFDIDGRQFDVPRRVYDSVAPGKAYVCSGNDMPLFGLMLHECTAPPR